MTYEAHSAQSSLSAPTCTMIQLRVKSPTGVEKIIDLCDNEEQMKKITVQKLKEIVNKAFMTEDNLKLVYCDQTMEEGTQLTTYKIRHMSVIHTFLELPGGI